MNKKNKYQVHGNIAKLITMLHEQRTQPMVLFDYEKTSKRMKIKMLLDKVESVEIFVACANEKQYDYYVSTMHRDRGNVIIFLKKNKARIKDIEFI